MTTGPVTPRPTPSAAQARTAAAASTVLSAVAAFRSFLESLPPEIATAPLPGGWSPAGHAWHVGTTNGVFATSLRGAGPLWPFDGASEFDENRWNFSAPPSVAAPDFLMPPAGIGLADALTLMALSAEQLAPAIAAVPTEHMTKCVQLPWG